MELGIEKEKIEKQLQDKYHLDSEQIDVYMKAYDDKVLARAKNLLKI